MLNLFIALSIFIPLISHAEEIIIDQLEGEWLNKNYLEILKATKSPIKAVDGIYYTSFSISKENNTYRWSQIYNFHEGISFYNIELHPTFESNIYQIVYEPIYEGEPVVRETYSYTLYIPGDKPFNEIEWIFGNPISKKPHIHFVRIEPNIGEFVNSIVLAGNYTDEQGQTFVFSKSGEAKWPDKSFRYKVGLDYIFSECDYFYIAGKRDKNNRFIPYAFSWESSKLYIFNTHFHEENTDVIERDKEPLYVLTPR